MTERALVGRTEELALLKERLRRASGAEGSCVVVVGEAGVGKTALVRGLRASASAGMTWLEGACLPEAGVPFLPFHEALTTHFALSEDDSADTRSRKIADRLKDASPELLQLVPVVGNMLSAGAGLYRAHKASRERETAPLESDPRQERERRFEAMATFLAQLARAHAPLVVFVDDLQWADPTSLAFFHYLARRVPQQPILLLATVRAEELDRETGEAIQVMSREGIVERVGLKPLAPPDLGSLVEREMGAALAADLAARVSAETDGNPLFAIESVRFLRDEGALEADADGRLRLRQGSQVRLPQKVQDVLARRSQRLSREERLLVDCAAVSGQMFDPVLVAEVLSQDPLAALQRFDDVARTHQLLVAASDERFAFAHKSLREYLQQSLSPALKRQYHLRIAKLLDQRGPRSDEEVTLIAHHAVAGKDAALGAKWSREAALRARKHYANEEALSHLRDAISLLPAGSERSALLEDAGDLSALVGDAAAADELYRKAVEDHAGSVNDRGRILTKQVEMWSGLGKLREAHEPFEDLEAIVGQLEPAVRTRALGVKNYYLMALGQDLGAAVAATEEALRLLVELKASPEALLKTYVRHASTLNYMGRFRDSLEVSEKASQLVPSVADAASRLRNEFNIGMALDGLGRPMEAVRTFQEGVAEAERAGHIFYNAINARELAFVHIEVGDLAAARSAFGLVEKGYEVLHDLGEVEAVRGRLLLAEGKLKDAAESLERGLEADRADGEFIFVPRFLADIAQARMAMGDLDGAERTAREAAQMGRHHLHIVPRARRTLGLVAAARDKRDEAMRQLDAALATFRELGMEGEVARTLVEKARLEPPGAARAHLKEALATFEKRGYAIDAKRAAQTLEALPLA